MRKTLILATTSCAFALLAAAAQTPPGPGPGPGAVAAVPASSVALPGDNIGSGQRMGPPPGMKPGAPPPGGGNMHEPGDTTPGPSLALALKAVQTAIDYCKAQTFNIGAAVIDSKGQIRAGLSEDGASGGHIYTAVRKGLAALAFGEPSGKVDRNDPKVTPGMATMAGAVPLYSKSGQLLGAIAGSGAASTKDEECAKAGADAIKDQL